jgi:hypothetical protein
MTAGTRREEIARFNKAKDDKEFAKMLKARTLGPEHSETQTQLRKCVRVGFFILSLLLIPTSVRPYATACKSSKNDCKMIKRSWQKHKLAGLA